MTKGTPGTEVCSKHSGFEEQLKDLCEDSKLMRTTLIGADMRSGLVKDFSDLRSDLNSKFDAINAALSALKAEAEYQRKLEAQKKKEKSNLVKGLAALSAAIATAISALAAFFR